MTINDCIITQCGSSQTAIIENSNHITYQELYNAAERKSDILKTICKSNANIGLILPNSAEYIEWYCAIMRHHSTVVPVYYQSSCFEIENIIKSCDLSVVISDDTKIKEIKAASRDFQNKICFVNSQSFEITYLNESKKSPESDNKNGAAVMLSTSGSMNNPKRVMLSDQNLIANAKSIISSINYNSNEKFLILLPLCFASANTSQLIVSILLGATVVLFKDTYHPKNIARAVETYGITSLTAVPSIFKQLVNSDDFQTSDLKSIKTICFGGGPTSSRLIEKAADKFDNINLVQMYGQTEASSRISHMFINRYRDYPEKMKSVGKPLNGILVEILDKNGTELKPGQAGEIVVSGENVMRGYYKQPDETKKVLKDNWLHTGDIGTQDDEGLLYITGRLKNMLIYSGINIYPEEIEDVIAGNNFIEDVVVYGRPDDSYGEVPVADIVLKQGRQISREDLIEYCSRFLPLHKIPVEFRIIQQLEKTKNGKTLRNRKGA